MRATSRGRTLLRPACWRHTESAGSGTCPRAVDRHPGRRRPKRTTPMPRRRLTLRGKQNVQCASNVDVGGEHRLAHRSQDGSLRPLMQDGTGVSFSVRDGRLVSEVCVDETGLRDVAEVLGRALREIIQSHDLVPVRREPTAQVRTEQSGRARDENAALPTNHHERPLRSTGVDRTRMASYGIYDDRTGEARVTRRGKRRRASSPDRAEPRTRPPPIGSEPATSRGCSVRACGRCWARCAGRARSPRCRHRRTAAR
jgi:hypothetical protein